MSALRVNFCRETGRIKPLHAVNNGPTGNLQDFQPGQVRKVRTLDNLEEYYAAGFPFARIHDASFFTGYGLDHTVDVAYIFSDFDADPEDPAAYDFTCTDHYLDLIEATGTKVFYRLGHRIEHEVKKFGTVPPKDFHKWAVICEHIIRHYTEGWANGSFRDIQYWEIWNEPDLNDHTWGGTREQFFDFYHVVATHLKQCFPHLKIGGPAVAAVDLGWVQAFLAQLKAPLDFFSWHIYTTKIEKITERIGQMRALLDQYGFLETESILNEWNYVIDWVGEDLLRGHQIQKTEKGAAFYLSAMCAAQAAPVDMLMYYDARPGEWSMFDLFRVGKVTTPAYYPFPMFDALYRLGTAVEVFSDDPDVYLCAAKSEREAAVVFARYSDDAAAEQFITLHLAGFGTDRGTEVEMYLLDGEHSLEPVQRAVFYGNKFVWEPKVANHTCCLLKLKEK